MRAGDVKATLRGLPVVDFQTLFGRRPLLVLAPHPDDESLGCGGLIAMACARSQEVHVAILTDGAASHPDSPTWPPERLRRTRRAEVLAATGLLGLPAGRLLFLDVPDSRAPHDPAGFAALVARALPLFAACGPGTICAPWRHDPHGDHVAAARLAAVAAERLDLVHYAYPIWAWTVPEDDDLPPPPSGARLDITPCLPLKRRAIDAHATQTTGMIDDSPRGFRMSPAFRASFEQPWETFLRER